MNPLTSAAIKLLRFPLAFMVVMWHCNFSGFKMDGGDYQVFNFLTGFFSEIIVRCSVPCFFVISGYLFFANVSIFNANVFKQKISSRISSLIIPYLCWSTLLICLYLILYSHDLSASKTIADFTFSEYIYVYISGAPIYENVSPIYSLLTGYGNPILIPFWFIRNLIVCVLFSPLIYKLFKHLRPIIGAIFLGAGLLSSVYWSFTGCYFVSLLWFSSGAFLSIKKIAVHKMKNQYYIVLLWLLAAIIGTLYIKSSIYNLCTIIIGVVACFVIALGFSAKDRQIPAILLDSTFFIYAAHFFLVQPTVSRISNYLPQNDLIFSIVFFAYPILITAICVLEFYIMRKIAPKLTGVLCGNRSTMIKFKLNRCIS